MPSVTQVVKRTKQPYGGYINPNRFDVIQFDDGVQLYESENVHSSIVGMAVDYLTRTFARIWPKAEFNERFELSDLSKRPFTRDHIDVSLTLPFGISIRGALRLGQQEFDKAIERRISIIGLDDASIYTACQLVGYDVLFRAGGKGYKPVQEICANKETIHNIRTYVMRALRILDVCGPVIMSGKCVGDLSPASIVTSGDFDYLTRDTLWDMKVSSDDPTSKHTLQLYIYYLLSCDYYIAFKNVRFLGIINPKLNRVYELEISKIPEETRITVLRDILHHECYIEDDYNDCDNQDMIF